MRKDDFIKDDILREYINTEKCEKAPEGFSSKVMSHIYTEVKPVKAEKSHRIPLIFAAIFIFLAIATVLFIPAGSIVAGFNIPLNFTYSFPEFDKMPVSPTMIYIIVAVIAILLLDSALGTIFKRERK